MRKQKTNVGALSVRNTKKNLPNCAQKGNKGITLVALILTIIVLLILAVVAIRAVQGDGILSHAKNAQTNYNSAQEEEQINIALNEWKIAQNLPGNTKTMKVFLEEKLAGIGANVTDFDKYVQITMPSNRIYKIDKTTNKEYVPDPALNPTGTIPVDATYTTGSVYGMGTTDDSNARIYTAGDNFPETLTPGDRYEYGDYTYYYSVMVMGSIIFPNQNGNRWCVKVNDTSKSSYGTIVESINGQPVLDMNCTFYGCTSITTAPTIPSSVTTMSRTFDGCTSLTTAPVIPNSVTDMQYTFSDCTSLTSMPTIGNSVVNMKETFKGCTSLTTASEIPNSVTDMENTFLDCTSLTSVPKIGNSVTNMYGTFRNCTSLTTAPTIPNAVTDMDSTFSDCTSLTTAPTIPNAVTDMDSTFLRCTNLTTVPTIPSSVTSMCNTFSGCTSLTSVPKIGNSVTNMYGTFRNCTSLTAAPTIPSSVIDMDETFLNCTSLKGNVEINGNPTAVATFWNCAQDEEHRITITGSASQETKEALKATGYNSGEFISIE